MGRFQNLLVAIDFSEDSDAALELAMELARPLKARVHLVHAYEIPSAAATAYGVMLPEGLWEQVRSAVGERLSAVQKRVREGGFSGESHLVEGSPASVITDTARATSADLIVMGTRGLSGLKHIVLGSVAERTVRTAPCPVMTVKKGS